MTVSLPSRHGIVPHVFDPAPERDAKRLLRAALEPFRTDDKDAGPRVLAALLALEAVTMTAMND
ncbi:hypothetical protein [Methylobacterium frigidaeris]|uniref:hypothetical protein n=1 Tax=Methylobacterium frigidaeris TaxID=2038277 RepID=UPI001056284E|nr:hypothetical protein [Methylobacterium frigidaeris]